MDKMARDAFKLLDDNLRVGQVGSMSGYCFDPATSFDETYSLLCRLREQAMFDDFEPIAFVGNHPSVNSLILKCNKCETLFQYKLSNNVPVCRCSTIGIEEYAKEQMEKIRNTNKSTYEAMTKDQRKEVRIASLNARYASSLGCYRIVDRDGQKIHLTCKQCGHNRLTYQSTLSQGCKPMTCPTCNVNPA